MGVQGGVDVFVDYPSSDADNQAAGLVMHPDVGKWVALGGGAYHLGEACRRLQSLSRDRCARTRRRWRDSSAAPRVLDGFADLLPDKNKVAKLYPGLSADAGGRMARTSAATPTAQSAPEITWPEVTTADAALNFVAGPAAGRPMLDLLATLAGRRYARRRALDPAARQDLRRSATTHRPERRRPRARAGRLRRGDGRVGDRQVHALNLVAGLDRPDAGSIHLDGVDLAALDDDALTALRRVKMGFVFQAFHVLPYLTVGQNVALPLSLVGVPDATAQEKVRAMLAAVGLGERSASMPRELSGGELQRVAIARALVHGPQHRSAPTSRRAISIPRARDRCCGFCVSR